MSIRLLRLYVYMIFFNWGPLECTRNQDMILQEVTKLSESLGLLYARIKCEPQTITNTLQILEGIV